MNLESLKIKIKEFGYSNFIKIKNNRILLANVANYKKIEITLEITNCLFDEGIAYWVDEDFNIILE